LSLSTEVKLFGNYRQVINVRDIEFCSALNDPNSVLSKIVESYGHFLQGVIHKCPYEISRIGIYNFTDVKTEQIDKWANAEQGIKLPKDLQVMAYKGDWRLKLKLATDDDPIGFDLMLLFTINFRNLDSF